MGTCRICGGAVFAANEVTGYGGPICRGNHPNDNSPFNHTTDKDGTVNLEYKSAPQPKKNIKQEQ